MTVKDTLKDRLARYRQINLTVVGRKSPKQSRFQFGSSRKAKSSLRHQVFQCAHRRSLCAGRRLDSSAARDARQACETWLGWVFVAGLGLGAPP